jgi:hypothetical protein
MSTQNFSLQELNAIGIAGLVVFLASWLAGVISFYALRRRSKPIGGGEWTWDRNDENARLYLRIFIGSCVLGVLSMIVALVFGGVPCEGPLAGICQTQAK